MSTEAMKNQNKDFNRTYSELMNEKPFDWNAFLSKESYTLDSLEEAMQLSQHWVTCACGNQCAAIPRDPMSGVPLDNILKQKGIFFTDCLLRMLHAFEAKNPQSFDQNKFWAWKALTEIEERAKVLLQDIILKSCS
jgi:hypothetical protein